MATAAVEAVASAALRSRLRRHGHVGVSVQASGWDMLAGRVDGAKVEGRLWESPLGLTARVLDVELGRVELDLQAVLAQQRIALRNVPTGQARVVFSGPDFGAFLQHPLVRTAAARAVRGGPFLFDREGVAVLPGPSGGVVFFSGTAAVTGQRYALAMRPAHGGRAASVTATPTAPAPAAASPSLSSSARSPSAPSRSAPSSSAQPPQTSAPYPYRTPQAAAAAGSATQNQALRSSSSPPSPQQPRASVPSTGPGTAQATAQAGARLQAQQQPQAPAAGGSLATAGSDEDDPAVSAELSAFFSALTIDLQGAELAFASMRVVPAAAVADGKWRPSGRAAEEGVLELGLRATLRSFPPLNVQF
ncbi:hypothetical protein HYH03_002759 [Edaphochlamys debaryana]|uniref:Uncharacterized protein n=1 Tax=Edaphochlamys debaryana TaxID=47281 RepID=A0A835YDB5_9CHLO|nr:hypothetical protein HYH03_002759 [Edaphochlamys debaryana]|eukprot:KAG2499178.1 hypothetical protein HYH03_002759 [Edaphochlamys debaryana]